MYSFSPRVACRVKHHQLLLVTFAAVLLTRPLSILGQEDSVTAKDFKQLDRRMNEEFMRGDDKAAADTCVELIEMFRKIVAEDDGRMKGWTTRNVPIMAYGGRREEAIALADRFITLSQKRWGTDHRYAHDARMLRELLNSILQLNEEELAQLADAERDSRRGEQLVKQNAFQDGIAALTSAQQVREQLLGTSNPVYVVDLMKLAIAASLAERAVAKVDPAIAIEYSRRSFTAVTEVIPDDACPGGHPLIADVAAQCGTLSYNGGNYQLARAAFECLLSQKRKLFPVAEFPDGHLEIVDAMLGLLRALVVVHAFNEAEPLVKQALEMVKKVDPNPRESERVATTLLFQAKIALALNKVSEAHQAIIMALGQFQDLVEGEPSSKELLTQCICLDLLVAVESRQGNYTNAEVFAQLMVNMLEEAYPKTEFPHGHFELAKGLSKLASTKSRLKKFGDAESLFVQSIEMYRTLLKDTPSLRQEVFLASILGRLGLCYYRDERYQKSIPYFQEALEIYESNRADTRLQYEQEAFVGPSLKLASALQKSGASHEEWLPHLQRATDIARQVFTKEAFPDGHPVLIEAIRSLALGKTLTGEHPEVIDLLVELLDMHFTVVAKELIRSDVEALRVELELLEVEVDWLTTYAFVLREREPRFVELAYRWFAPQKSMVLDALVRSRQYQRELNTDEELAELVESIAYDRDRLRELIFNPPRDKTPEEVEASRMEREFKIRMGENTLMLALSERSKIVAAGPIPLDRIRNQLARHGGDVLIDVVRMSPHDLQASEVGKIRRIPARYMAFIVLPKNQAKLKLVDLGSADEIDQLVADLRQQIIDVPDLLDFSSEEAVEEGYRESAVALYRQVLAPLKDVIAGAKTVFLALDGELNRIAFEALVDEQGQYLIENHRFAYLSSASDLLRTKSEPGTGVVIFADPDYNLDLATREAQKVELNKREATTELASRSLPDDGTRGLSWDPLPGTAKEVELLIDVLSDSEIDKPVAFTRAQALEDYLKRVTRPRLLHLATHGYYLPEPNSDRGGEVDLITPDGPLRASQIKGRLKNEGNPLLNSGIVLAGANVVKLNETDDGWSSADPDDGWVTAEEVAMLDLRGTELVVLSACETGLADVRNGENVSGLRRAFIHAGAQNLVTSLYKVPDSATQELMVGFYTNLKEQPPIEALRQASLSYMRERRESEGAAHPFFWSSFVFIGAP